MTANQCAAEQLRRQMLEVMNEVKDGREEFVNSGAPESPKCAAHGKMTVGISQAIELLLMRAIIATEREQQAAAEEVGRKIVAERERSRTWREVAVAMIPVIFGSGIVSTIMFYLWEKLK